MYQGIEEIELVIRGACGAWTQGTGNLKALRDISSRLGRGAGGRTLHCFHKAFISCETWLLGILLDRRWHCDTAQFLSRVMEASVFFCYHKGYFKQFTGLEDINLSPAWRMYSCDIGAKVCPIPLFLRLFLLTSVTALSKLAYPLDQISHACGTKGPSTVPGGQ